jgi:hypothetical protein
MATAGQQQFDGYEFIFGVPKPRRVRVKTMASIILGALPLASAFLAYSSVQTIRASLQVGAKLSVLNPVVFELVFLSILMAVSSVTYWMVRRDKAVLMDGELALGVVHQRLVEVRGGRGGRRKQSRVRYRFKDASGQLFQDPGTDYSRRLRVDMTVPINLRIQRRMF